MHFPFSILVKKINLTNFVAGYLHETEFVDFIKTFEDELNEVFSGKCLADPQATHISILEKIDQLMDLNDPDRIDVSKIHHLASNLGYNMTVNILQSQDISEQSQELKKYVRFFVSSLVEINRMKTTKDCIRGLMHSVGVLTNIYYRWTDEYDSSSDRHWRESNENDVYDDNGIENVHITENDFYLTPHFRLDLDISNVDLTTSELMVGILNRVAQSVDAVKPVNTVSQGLSLSLPITLQFALKGVEVSGWGDGIHSEGEYDENWETDTPTPPSPRPWQNWDNQIFIDAIIAQSRLTDISSGENWDIDEFPLGTPILMEGDFVYVEGSEGERVDISLPLDRFQGPLFNGPATIAFKFILDELDDKFLFNFGAENSNNWLMTIQTDGGMRTKFGDATNGWDYSVNSGIIGDILNIGNGVHNTVVLVIDGQNNTAYWKLNGVIVNSDFNYSAPALTYESEESELLRSGTKLGSIALFCVWDKVLTDIEISEFEDIVPNLVGAPPTDGSGVSQPLPFELAYIEQKEISMMTVDNSNGQRNVSLIARDMDGNDVSDRVGWSSTNNISLPVNTDGIVTAFASGSSTITATYLGISKMCVVTSYDTVPPKGDLWGLRGGYGDNSATNGDFVTFEPETEHSLDLVSAKTIVRSKGNPSTISMNRLVGVGGIGFSFNNDSYGTRFRITKYNNNGTLNYQREDVSLSSGNDYEYEVAKCSEGYIKNGSPIVWHSSVNSSWSSSTTQKSRFGNATDEKILECYTTSDISYLDLDDPSNCEIYYNPKDFIAYSDFGGNVGRVKLPNRGTLGTTQDQYANNVPSKWFDGI